MGGAHDRRKMRRFVDGRIKQLNASTPSRNSEHAWTTKWSWVVGVFALALCAVFFVYQFLFSVPSRLVLEPVACLGVFCFGLTVGSILSTSPRFVLTLAVVLTGLTFFPIDHLIQEKTKPSFAYVLPVVVVALRADAPVDTWEFSTYHYGPRSSEGVKLFFQDVYKTEALIYSGDSGLKRLDVPAFQKEFELGDVNPNGLGSLGMSSFSWTPLTLDHERYRMEISAKDRNISEKLDLERAGKSWTWHMSITDRQSREVLVDCRYGNFAGVRKDLPRCADVLPHNIPWKEAT